MNKNVHFFIFTHVIKSLGVYKPMNIMNILKRHTENSFKSIQILFDTFNDNDFEETVNGFPIWQHFYHMLNSMDRIFTDPKNYQYPEFHIDNINNLENKPIISYSKECIYKYFLDVKDKINNYLDKIFFSKLLKKSNHKTIEMTKLDHVLSQFRHMAFHIGYLHSCAKVLYGNTPEHISV